MRRQMEDAALKERGWGSVVGEYDQAHIRSALQSNKLSDEETNEVIDTARKIIDLLRVKWSYFCLTKTMLKIHALFTHLIPQMTMWNGIYG